MNLKLYNVDPDFCDYLRKFDQRVPHTMHQKSTRPFVGVVLLVNNFNYYTPLTSPKSKHLTMKNQIDFLKINNGKWGAINFNNMIPIDSISLTKIDMKIYPSDDLDKVNYKTLLASQISWCNSNKKTIEVL